MRPAARPRSRLRVRVRTAAAVLATVGVVLGGPWPVANADPSITSAQAQAAALDKQVQALQVQAELATEQYNAVEEQLGEVVTRYVDATERVGDLTRSDEALRAQQAARVRALYMAGGQLGLYASVLDGRDINDVLERATAVSRVLEAGALSITGSGTAVQRASADATALDALAQQRTDLQVKANVLRVRVVGLLEETQNRLASANSLVRTLVDQQRARQEAAAFAAASHLLGTSAQPPIDLPPGTPPVVVAAIAAARTRLGAPYVWGATGPTTFDCSGLTSWAYGQAGLALPRTSREQWFTGPHPALDALLPGDLLFWATDPVDPGSIHHVAIYLGSGYMIEAPHTGAFVQVTPVYLDGYFGATRPLGSGG